MLSILSGIGLIILAIIMIGFIWLLSTLIAPLISTFINTAWIYLKFIFGKHTVKSKLLAFLFLLIQIAFFVINSYVLLSILGLIDYSKQVFIINALIRMIVLAALVFLSHRFADYAIRKVLKQNVNFRYLEDILNMDKNRN